MEIAKRLQGIGEYYFSQKLREIDELNRQGKNVINLGIGSPDLPPHPDVIRVLQQECARPDVHAYQSYKGSPVLRRAISQWYDRWYGVSLDADREILPLIGSKEGILHVCMTYLNEGDEALVPDPGYPTYRSAVQLAGGRCVPYVLEEKNGYEPDFRALEQSDLTRVRLMWVNYPQMPTGQLPTRDLLARLVEFGRRHGILICHDNPYSFILNDAPMSLLVIPGARETALELNSLSKSHNMAGWRVGMLCGAASRVEEVLRFKSNMDSGMFLPLQLAAARALSLDRDWYDQVNATYRSRRQEVFALLDLLGCRYATDQAGMFVWARIPAGYESGFALSDEVLREAAVFITPGGIFGEAGNRYIRVSLCSPQQRFQESIERIRLAGLKQKTVHVQ
ncbi:MAG TPA: aminotransferase class I/II-fold pyridoxal phosphate-dependent enzyme [Chitinophagaceae bacterium]|nr:aminotransferase class I/II-fold pyridoxal phosphate-dependent enzyme [Chitinophagaceae bacterium]